MSIGIFIVGLLMGFLVVLHISMNASVGNITENPHLANTLFWLVGFITTLVIGIYNWDIGFFKEIKNVPKWLFLAGLIGSFLALGMNYLIPKIGASTASILVIFGQLVGGMIISHYGFFNSAINKISIVKLIGIMFVLAGSILAIYGKIPFINKS